MTTERHRRRWLILVVLCLSTIVLIIDNFALNVAVPAGLRRAAADPRPPTDPPRRQVCAMT
jgi:hypothetical protein